MRGLVLAAVAGLALAAGEARADTTLKLTEVITSPPRTEFLKGQLAEFEQANPGVKVEVTSLPWGQAFEKLATMVQGGNMPDVVEMPDRWLALYASGEQLESLKPWMDKWDDTGSCTEPRSSSAPGTRTCRYMVPYGFYIRAMFWNKKLFQAGGPERAAGDRWTSSSRTPTRSRPAGQRQVRLLPARRPRRHQRLHHVHADPDGQQRVLRPARQLDPQPARARSRACRCWSTCTRRATCRRTA